MKKEMDKLTEKVKELEKKATETNKAPVTSQSVTPISPISGIKTSSGVSPQTPQTSYVTQAVRLEIGTLAAWTPSEAVHIVPDIQKIYPMLFDGDFIEVRTVLPERTFWEKATILHHEANRPKELAIPKRYARHYYDLVCIANSRYKDRAFKSFELLEKVVQFKQKFYPRKWAKYEEATTETIRLMPDEYRLKEIKDDYKNMTEMFFGEYPSFEELMNSVLELEKEIHKIK